ncbi:hemerythrin domain-containing protein [Aestuariivirga sp.]|uniref:hemerythrin domain-containing protein n=1 Tax=Aestuariivirga sp. TaxID=2650926 RepID=UPI00391DA0AA
MKFEIPAAMKAEHDELHADLVKATKAGGDTGEAAKALARVLHGHFVGEEEFAMPPLGLLQSLASGAVTPDMADVLKMTDRLEAEMPKMMAEHRAITAALDALIAAARKEAKPELEAFAKRLKLHAQAEEQLAYPASILVGRYVKQILARA